MTNVAVLDVNKKTRLHDVLEFHLNLAEEVVVGFVVKVENTQNQPATRVKQLHDHSHVCADHAHIQV